MVLEKTETNPYPEPSRIHASIKFPLESGGSSSWEKNIVRMHANLGLIQHNLTPKVPAEL